MALAYPHLKFLLEVRKSGVIKGPIDIMELGEQNWFGDVNPVEVLNAAKLLGHAEARYSELEAEFKGYMAMLNGADAEQKKLALFKLAELYYKVLFDVKSVQAVDLHGTAKAKRHDLNEPLPINEKFDLLINFGTGEHVFNQYMFFKNAHDLTKKGGFIAHSMPNQGCYDHGFYNYHPTFIFDLARFNKYNIAAVVYVDLSQKPAVMFNIDRVSYVKLAVEKKLSNYSAILAVMQKTSDEPFVIPQQAYYDNALPPELQDAWSKLDR